MTVSFRLYRSLLALSTSSASTIVRHYPSITNTNFLTTYVVIELFAHRRMPGTYPQGTFVDDEDTALPEDLGSAYGWKEATWERIRTEVDTMVGSGSSANQHPYPSIDRQPGRTAYRLRGPSPSLSSHPSRPVGVTCRKALSPPRAARPN